MSDRNWASELSEAVLVGNSQLASDLTREVLDSDTLPEEILDKGLVPAMAEAGRRFEDQRFFLPELMFAARAMRGPLDLIKPLLAEREVPPIGRVVIGTVAGDLHDIGKNIVAAMLEGGGFQVIDLGTNVTPATFVDAAREHDADIIGISALLTTTMPVMQEVVDEAAKAGLAEKVKVVVGGAPLTSRFATEIGADGYAASAAKAVNLAQRILSGEEWRETEDPGVLGSVDHQRVRLVEPALEKFASEVSTGEVPDEGTTPRDLVKETLEFKGPSRLPRQLWVLPWATKRYPEEAERIERDFPPDITVTPSICSEPVPGGGNAHSVGMFVDAWGCTFHNLHEGIIGQVKDPQISDWSEVEKIRFPRERLTVDTEKVAEFCRGTDQYVLSGTCPRPFERLQFLRGSENLYLDLNRPPKELLDLLERMHEFYMEELTLWAKTDVDGLSFMDDWGSQRSLLVAPDLWRELFKPLYADYISIAHAHGKHAFMHSDGHITEIIPDLIDIGLDALNSQVFCMGVEELGSRFAGDLTFWGEIDRQQLLPRASTAEIAEAAEQMRSAFHRDGGLIAQCEFGPGAKPENVYAFFEALSEGAR